MLKQKEKITMNKAIGILCFLLLACLSLSLMAGCTTPAAPPAANGGEPGPQEQPNSNISASQTDRVDVVFFHRTQQCYSCKYLGAKTLYTVETYFKDELASGRVTFQSINVQDEANADIIKKYGAYTSSLFINTIEDGTDHIEEATKVYSLIGKDEAFVETLKSKIEKSLNGEA